MGDTLRQGLRRYRRGVGCLGRRPEPRRRAASPGIGQVALLPTPGSKAEGPAGGQTKQFDLDSLFGRNGSFHRNGKAQILPF